MCDFEPLNKHVQTLHQLVQAAQSVDEMSQTITDLLSEQRVMTCLFASFLYITRCFDIIALKESDLTRFNLLSHDM